jgi:hypothetical protein
MMGDDFGQNLALGQEAESMLAKCLARRGHHAMRIFPEQSTGIGPRIETPTGAIVSPDIIAVTGDGNVIWFEVKSKGVPGYRYSGENRGWEHGVDWGKFRDYGRLAERASVNIMVRELKSPPSLDPLPERFPPKVNGKPDWTDYHKHLVDREVWRWISYERCLSVGRKQDNWKSQKCRDGVSRQISGWLWPIREMHVFDGFEAVGG